jgi:hypothetical protein
VKATFEQLTAPILALKTRSEILLEAVPAPQKLAPHALAMTADVLEDAATGRFVLLHDPAAIDAEMASDPLLPNIGWAWLIEALKKNGCEFISPSGTVTRVESASFGDLKDREEDSEMEIRASWTPTSGENLLAHVNAWIELLGMSAGLEPIPEGVSSISRNS